MNMKKLIAMAAAWLLMTAGLFAQEREFTNRIYHSSIGQDLPYQVLYPRDFNPSGKYPLILFLHGAGERGTDGIAQTGHGHDVFAGEATAGAIVVAPQCPWEDSWVRMSAKVDGWHVWPEKAPISGSLLAVKELLDAMISLGFVDEDAIYCTGLSMGGMGTLDLVMRYPDFFAAVQPICGGVNIERARAYRGKTVFRFFHGLADDTVNPEGSINTYNVLKENGHDATLVTYEGVNHNSWDNAFKEPDYISWFFRYRKD